MFLRWRRDRSRNSAISKISSYINPAQNTTPRNVLEATPTAPVLQCHSPARFQEDKPMFSYAFKLQNQDPRSMAQGTPNTKPTNTCWRRLPQPPNPAMPQPCPLSTTKSVCFRTELRNRVPAAWARRSYQRLIKSESLRCA